MQSRLGFTATVYRTSECQVVELTDGSIIINCRNKARSGNHMTIRTSHDDGNTWNEGYLYDVRQCMGYSCIAMCDDDHVGIFYETCHNNGKNGCRGIGFIRIP